MRALKFITGHVIYNPTYTYKFQLKTTLNLEHADFQKIVTYAALNSEHRSHGICVESIHSVISSF